MIRSKILLLFPLFTATALSAMHGRHHLRTPSLELQAASATSMHPIKALQHDVYRGESALTEAYKLLEIAERHRLMIVAQANHVACNENAR